MEFMPNYRLIGVRIKKRRLALKLTQESLAEKTGIGIQHMSKIENGNTKLSLPCLIALANALHTTVDSDCTPSEIYVLTQTINTLKWSMRTKGLSDY